MNDGKGLNLPIPAGTYITEYIQERDGSTHMSFVDNPLLLNPAA